MEKQYKNFPESLEKKLQTPERKNYISSDSNTGSKEKISCIRPTLVTMICGYFFIDWSFWTVSAFYVLFKTRSFSDVFLFSLNSVESWIGLISGLAMIVGIFGYWFMKKWGVYLYTSSIIILVIYNLVKSNYSSSGLFFLSTILPLFVIIVGIYYKNQMD